MARDARTLGRIHRVRTMQLTLAHADEARVRAQMETEAALTARIASLAAAVAPTAEALSGVALRAGAHYRERLHQTAVAATQRVERAEQAAAAAAATRAARQDQGAVEKLIEHARHAEAAAERRALEDLPATAGKRHGSC